MITPLRVFATVYIFLMIFLSWVVAWTLQTITKLLVYPFTTLDQRQDICAHIFRKCSFLFADVLNPFWKSAVLSPFPALKPNTKFLVVMNHLSNADPWFAVRPILPYDCKWICKGSLFSVPFGGWGLANNGDLAIQFTAEKDGWGTKKGSVSAMMDRCKQLLGRAQPIAVFPEGVRNPKPEGPLGEFKLGFFTLAVEQGLTIVPLALSGSDKAWPRGDWKFDAATCYFSFGEPIEAVGCTAEELRDKVWKVITDLREAHPDRKKSQ